jgi:hypothetical protein
MLLRHLLRTFDTTAVILVLVFSTGLTLALRASIFGIPLGMLLISWFFKYAYVLLEDVAHGAQRSPVMSIEMVNPVQQRPLGQLVIFAAFYAAADFAGGALRTAILIVATLLIPASIAVLGASGKFFQALNPVALLRVVRGLGPLYLQILAIVVVLNIATAWIWSSDVWFIIKLAEAQFALLATFNVIGGALYEKRDTLDLDVMQAPELDAQKESQERARELAKALDHIYAGVRVRKYGETAPALDRWFADVEPWQLPQDVTQIMTAVLSWQDPIALRPIACSLIARLQAARLPGEALDVLEAAQSQIAAFEVDTPEQAVRLAELAIAAGRRPLARRLLIAYASLPIDSGPGRRMGELRTQIER